MARALSTLVNPSKTGAVSGWNLIILVIRIVGSANRRRGFRRSLDYTQSKSLGSETIPNSTIRIRRVSQLRLPLPR